MAKLRLDHSLIPYLLILILLLAFGLRAGGLDFGLPYVFHDDEHQYVDAGIAFLQSPEARRAELEKLNNPPLFKAGLGVLYSLSARLLLGDSQAIAAALDDELWRTFFHYLGRLAGVWLSVLTVALLYAVGRRLYRRQTGLLAAFLLAASFLHVRESHFAVNDAPLTFLAVATLYTGAGILRRGRWFDYAATGFLIGLAAATKYTGVYLAVLLILAHGLRYFRGIDPGSPALPLPAPRPASTRPGWLSWLFSPRWLVGLGLVPVGFILGAPVVVTAWPEMIRRMGRLAEYGREGYHDLLLAPYTGWIFYLGTLAWGVGMLLFVVCMLAVVAGLIYRSSEDLLLLTFPALLYVMMAQQQMVFVRFILPALPPLVLLAAVWLERFSAAAARWSPRLKRQRVLIAATVLVALQPLIWSIWFDWVLSRPDTRELAAAWVETHLPPGTVIYDEDHALPHESVTGRVSWPYVQLEALSFDEPDPLVYYRQRGVQFILTSDFHHERRFAEAAQEAGRQQWVAALTGLKPVAEFQPYWLPAADFAFDQRYGPWSETPLRLRPGPVIRIYAVEPPPNWAGLDPFEAANQIPDKAALFGYELNPRANIRPGELVSAVVYWLNRGWQPADALIVSLVDPAGFEITQAVAGPMPEFAGALERGDKIIKSEAGLLIPPGTPPGAYRVRFRGYDQAGLQTRGTVEAEGLTVAEAAPVSPVSDGPAPADRVLLAPGLRLAAYDLAVTDSAMQNTLAFDQANWLVLLWRAEDDLSLDYRVQLALLDAQDHTVAAWAGQPVHGQYPTSRWQAGQLVRDPWNLTLPESLPGEQGTDGTYRLVLTVLDEADRITGRETLDLMQISARARSSDIPAMQHTLDAVWGDAVRLLGFNIRAVPDSERSGWLELDLYWRGLAPVETDYPVRLSLINAQGQVVLAQEGQPAGGQAPTGTWQPGEVIHDFHSLRYENLDMGDQYRLELSLIDPGTGEPVPAGGAEALLLTSWP